MVEFEQGMSDVEEYANAFYYFNLNLGILSQEPGQQCEMKGYDNVAWELKSDIVRWADIALNISGGKLSSDQREEISHLRMEVASIPDSVVPDSNSREDHLRSMKDPAWISIRGKAKNLINLLKDEIDRTNEILHLK
jgi:hypothetical protein